MFEQARMQWQFGDWESLSRLDEVAIAAHPERARLALLIACAYQQLNDHISARHHVQLARTWGCDKKIIARLLIAGVHNTLGRASALADDETRTLGHFVAAVDGVSGDTRLACQARSVREVARLGLFGRAGTLIERQLGSTLRAPQLHHALAAVPGIGHQGMRERMQDLARTCLDAEDIHATVDAQLESPSMDPQGAFLFCTALADEFKSRGDNMTAVHYLNTARQHLDPDNAAATTLLSKKMLAFGQNASAIDLLVQHAVGDADLDTREKAQLSASYVKSRAESNEKSQHGHAVLLAHMKGHLDALRQQSGGRTLILIEIGSTRENVPGQGSTRIIADYCQTEKVDFITVDMDPHNTASAASMFKSMGTSFKAVNQKGEDFLREYEGDMDFVFLDAYDFDHGKHSELRQSRYEKFLGSRIDETECHQMHLDCAQSVHAKLSPHGLVCVDDTWLVDGKWTAKGTLAMPYLLGNGFELVDARNRAALLRRKAAVS